jgi:pSer/pThr/pTyr-binding forkhead associated (FHA) protein
MQIALQDTIKLSLMGETLVETKTKPIELPGVLKMQSEDVQSPHQPDPVGARLIRLNGVYADQTFILADGRVIGRSSSSSIHIEDQTMPRQHAHICSASGRWYIQDMDSSIRIFVNNEKVDASPLNNGDHIRLGGTEFEFHA